MVLTREERSLHYLQDRDELQLVPPALAAALRQVSGMNSNSSFLLTFFFIVLGPTSGGLIGYYIGRKRGASIVLSVIVGFLGGPCLGALIVCVLPATGISPSGWHGAGRSFGADEDPRLGSKK